MSNVTVLIRYVLVFWTLWVSVSMSQSPLWAATPGAVAEIDGQTVTLTELEAFAASPLQELDRQRQQILEAGLTQLIEQKLLDLEASRRGVEVGALLAEETKARTSAVTDADIDAWFSENEARLRQPKEAVLDQIRPYLESQRQQKARTDLIKELRKQYRVVTLIQPQRVDLDLTGVPTKGPQDAVVTLVEFSDFQCPYCQRINSTLDEVLKIYGDQVRIAFMQFPLTSIHKQAFKAAEATLCADAQGKFWPMHDAIFAQPRNLTPDDLKSRAVALELDADAFAQCLDSGEMSGVVSRQMAAGRAAGVSGTPTFMVNGRLLELKGSVPPIDQISAMIDDELSRLAE